MVSKTRWEGGAIPDKGLAGSGYTRQSGSGGRGAGRGGAGRGRRPERWRPGRQRAGWCWTGVVEDGTVLDRADGRGGGGQSSGQGGARPGAVENGVAAGAVLDRQKLYFFYGPGREQRKRVDLKIYGHWGQNGGTRGGLSVRTSIGPVLADGN
jgi:hypothetical protein